MRLSIPTPSSTHIGALTLTLRAGLLCSVDFIVLTSEGSSHSQTDWTLIVSVTFTLAACAELLTHP